MPAVAIVGASAKVDRPSHQAVLKYRAAGWTVWPIHPSGEAVAGLATLRSLAELPRTPEVVSLYVNPKAGLDLVPALATAKPRYVWLNPGADSPELADALRAAGLAPVVSCNLVALSLGDPLQIAARQLATH